MSNIGKQPIPIPADVQLLQNANEITVKGKLGELKQVFHPAANISVNNDEIVVTRSSDERQQRELHGLTRVLIANMIEGVSSGFQKELNLVGVGYSADASQGNFMILNLGFSHTIYFEEP